MKGAELHIKASIITALVLGSVIAVFQLAESWSQLHLTVFDALLYATLFFIIVAFFKSASHHPEKKKEITKLFWKRISFRLEHAFNCLGYLFGGVLILGVNSEIPFVEYGHLIFTGSAIVLGYITILIYPETNIGKAWSYWATAFGLGGFVLGFFFSLYSIAWAEVCAAIPLAIFLILTMKK